MFVVIRVAALSVIFASSLLLGGCVKNAPAPEAPPSEPAAQNTPTPSGGGGGGITPMSPGVGGISPVAGTESVQGAGGGGVGIAAKDAAKRAAAGAGSPAGMSQMGAEGGE